MALGHNADDRIESLFLRLMRGSNLSGLHALHAVRTFNGITWLRPLLDVSRAGIEAYLVDCGVTREEIAKLRSVLVEDVGKQ